MSDSRASIAEEIFAEALDLPRGPRTAFIDERCQHDTALKDQVRELINESEQVDGAFLDPNEIRQLTAAGTGLEHAADEPTLQPGTQLGAYTIRGVLGIGGMGVVYRAEQDRPHRTVALKVIRRGLGTRGILKRFEHEAEVLGRLLHPGIAQIYEAGTATVDGREQPFISMELVEGLNLTHYVAKRSPDTNARLAIFASLCDAVNHAHQRGIIHRDLKPGNILVTERGDPKVLDFGVARAVHSDLVVTTLRTNIGQLIGTLAYMSPEQVVGDPADIDIRSDVYSLGVILYELLTGRLPHDLGSRSIPEAARIIREDRPTKLSHVSRVFRGDLDTIVSKAIEKELPRRYQSAADLAADIRRYLAGEPIQARQDSAWYLLRRGFKRYRTHAIAALVVLCGLVVFAVYAGIQATRYERLSVSEKNERVAAESARELAAKNAEVAKLEGQSAQRLSDFLSSVLSTTKTLRPVNGNQPSLVDLLDNASARLENGELASDPQVEASVRKTLASSYNHVELMEPRIRHLEWLISHLQKQPDSLDNQLQLGSYLVEVGQAWSEAGDYPKAESILSQAEDVFRKTGDAGARGLTSARGHRANALHRENKMKEAIALYEAVAEESQKLDGPDSNSVGFVYFNLGGANARIRNLPKADDYYQRALKILDKTSPGSITHIRCRLSYARDCLTPMQGNEVAKKHFEETLEWARTALGNDHPETMAVRLRWAMLIFEMGDKDTCIETMRQDVATLQRSQQSMAVGEHVHSYRLALYLTKVGQLDEAIQVIDTAVARAKLLSTPTQGRSVSHFEQALIIERQRGNHEAEKARFAQLTEAVEALDHKSSIYKQWEKKLPQLRPKE